MKYLVIASIFIFYSANSFGQNLGKEWRLARDENNVKVWLLSTNSDITGTFQINKRSKPINWKIIKKEDFFRSLEVKKRKLLSLIGVSDWEAKDYAWKQRGNIAELTIRGSYKDSSGQLIKFQELHIFEAKRTIQILYTEPNVAGVSPNIGQKFIIQVSEWARKR